MDSSEHRDYLHDLSLRLVRLSGNERIRKRIRGAGGGDAFNVLDEVPQFTLDHLLAGKTLGLIPYPNIEDVLKDEKTKEFEDAFQDLREQEGREFGSLDKEEERELKDRVREVLELPPIEEILPDHSIDLPKTPTGEEEAERAVDLILEHMEKFPKRSLGVAVLNLRQATRIEELFEEKASGNSVVTEFLNHWQETPEYFFIKNLENVQGDERDVILIATVFGKNSEGKVYQRFGPISQPQGENRINVLITRAKKRVLVCTSLEPTDLTLEKEGPQVLSRYLSYAAAGKLPRTARKNSEDLASAQEKWFCKRLRSDGYEVDPQVGISGWRVNLGIKSQDKPGEYLCGIELDGPSYHLAPGARDRDVGRPFILESKGWNIFRVWSIDFFHDPEAEYSRIVRLIENAKSKESD